MSIAAQCPSCGAPIAFHVSSSLIAVCEHCSTAVARTDQDLRAIGKVAALHRTQSPLTLWLSGNYQGADFVLTGRAQFRHGAGGVWDEWYLSFADGRWGWLAEAQGRFYLTFAPDKDDDEDDDHFEVPGGALVPGNWVQVGKPPVAMMVAEVGVADLLAARGEIPYLFRPGQSHGYADLSGAAGEFATVDFGDERPTLYLGREVTLDELGIARSEPAQEAEPGFHGSEKAHVEAVTCSNCGGALELRAPELTERVACPYCAALFDCNHGVLEFVMLAMRASKQPAVRMDPAVPLGAQGRFEGETFTVIGSMKRSTGNAERYYWDEYLLYHPRLGFRWLIWNYAHWTYTRPVPPASVNAPRLDGVHRAGEKAEYDGKEYKLFESAHARVEHVAGEFYWKVQVDQVALMVDYIRPPEMLSGERSATEINWSLGTYMTRAEVAACFEGVEISSLEPISVGPNQPFPHKAVYKIWAVLTCLALVAILTAAYLGKDKRVYTNGFALEPGKRTEPEVLFSEPFELEGGQNLRIRTRGSVSNSWMYVQGDLFNEQTGLVVQFDMPMELYFGVLDGETWREDSSSNTKYLSAVPAGTYSLRLSVERSDAENPAHLAIDITQGVLRISAWLWLLVGISIIPLCVFFYNLSFEKRRWSESDYGSSWHSGDDD